jgi:hypothetical protein
MLKGELGSRKCHGDESIKDVREDPRHVWMNDDNNFLGRQIAVQLM